MLEIYPTHQNHNKTETPPKKQQVVSERITEEKKAIYK
jgi:hypothetical protein